MNIISTLPYLDPTYTHQPIAFILNRFLKKYKIDISSSTLHQKLIAHPYFPSLLSISDVLTSINVSNQAYKIDLDTLKANYESPILIYLKIGEGLFCILNKIAGERFQIITQKGDTKWLDEEKFKEVWEGVVLDVESTDQIQTSIESDGGSYPAYLKYLAAACWAGITFYIIKNQIPELTFGLGITLLLNICGVSISWLLVLQHLNKNNLLVQQLCQSETQEGCSTVLNNKTAQLTPWLSMADAGLIYFSGNILLILFFASQPLLYLLAFAGPLFSIYAVYLQAYVIKQWCRLCMAVHVVIFCFFITSVSAVWPGFRFPAIGELVFFLLPGLVWLFVKPYIKRIKNADSYQTQYATLKYNPEVFSVLIKQQPKINIPQSLKVFSFGHLDAAHELTFVSNPYCEPCAQAHAIIDGWLNQNICFKINIIFTHSIDKNERRRKFVAHLGSVHNSGELQKVLHSWFTDSDKNVQKWADKYQLKAPPLPYHEKDLQEWLKLADVEATPIFFINGRKLPKTYRLTDIRHLITEVSLTDSESGKPMPQL